MLRRGPDQPGRPRGRIDSLPNSEPFEREPKPEGDQLGAPPGLNGWSAPASYLALDPQVVCEITRAALSSPAVATLRGGEIAVGAMLASLALRGEDPLLDALLPLAGAELRLHRYAVGQLTPIAVHRVASVGDVLRSLSRCATEPPGETWEAVAHDGSTAPVAIAAARSHELRWLQPPADDSPHAAPWAAVTSEAPVPGSQVGDWRNRLRPAPGRPSAPIVPPQQPAEPTPAFPTEPASTPAPPLDGLAAAVTAAVEQALANAPLELDLDAATLDELRDTSVLERVVEAVARLERQVGQVDAVSRQVAALTAAIDDLTDANRALLRHQWDNMPPAGFWTRVQKADEEVRRSVDELAAEVRGRLRAPR